MFYFVILKRLEYSCDKQSILALVMPIVALGLAHFGRKRGV